MCLCNFARREQLDDVITRLLRQTCKPRIIVWNNDTNHVFKDSRVDWVINSSENVHTRHIVYLWQEASTEFVGRMDDDLYPGDDFVLEDALKVTKELQHPEQILGAFGVRLYLNESYERGHHISVPKGHGQLNEDQTEVLEYWNHLSVDLVKGRFMLMRQLGTRNLRVGFRHYHSDLYVSTALAERRRLFHFVGGCFFGREDVKNPEACRPRLVDYPMDDFGYCADPLHAEQRNALATKWVSQCFPDQRVKARPDTEETDEAPADS